MTKLGLHKQFSGLVFLLFLAKDLIWDQGSLFNQISRFLYIFTFSAISSRIVSTSWFVFILIMLNCYTANLAAFLTNNNAKSNLNSINDLLKQNEINFGTYPFIYNLLKVEL